MVSQPGSSGTGRWNSRRRCGQTTRDSIARTITARVGSHSVQWDDERAREARLHAANGGINRALIMQDQHEGIQHEHESRTHLARIGGSRKRRISDAFLACARVLLSAANARISVRCACQQGEDERARVVRRIGARGLSSSFWPSLGACLIQYPFETCKQLQP